MASNAEGLVVVPIGRGVGGGGESIEETWLDRRVGAGVERGDLDVLVGGGGRTPSGHPSQHGGADALQDLEEIGSGRREGGVEDGELVGLAGEEAFEEQHVEVDVEVERAPEALHEGHGTGASAVRSGAALHPALDLVEEDAGDDADEGGRARGEDA